MKCRHGGIQALCLCLIAICVVLMYPIGTAENGRSVFVELGLKRGTVALMPHRREWEDEAERIMCARLPERLHDKVHYFVYDWDKPLRPVRDMAPLVRELKAKGYGIYLLSNAASRQHVYWPDIPGSECFDGTLISADELLTKPEREIYELFLERFGLRAEECVFIDDNTVNAEGAYRCGLHPIVFHDDVDELRARLREEGVDA